MDSNKKAHRLGVAGFILSIVSILMAFVIPFAGMAAGIVGVFLAVISKREGDDSGIRVSGFALSIIGIVTSVGIFVFYVAVSEWARSQGIDIGV